MTTQTSLIGTCRAHGHWFPVDRVHEPCPEPGCEAACDYYARLSDAELLHRSRVARDPVEVLRSARSVTELCCTCEGNPWKEAYTYRGDGKLHCGWCDGLLEARPDYCESCAGPCRNED